MIKGIRDFFKSEQFKELLLGFLTNVISVVLKTKFSDNQVTQTIQSENIVINH